MNAEIGAGLLPLLPLKISQATQTGEPKRECSKVDLREVGKAMLLRKRKSWIGTCEANPALKRKKEISLGG
jgi:hypothetical protein